MRKKYPLSVWGTLAGLIAIAAAFYALNVLTCLYTDDFSYRYTFAVTTGKYPISNLYELYLSQRNHYRVMNGRTVAHVLAQLFLMWGKPVFNVINTASFMALGLLIYRHGQGRGARLRPLCLFSVFAALWLLPPNFGESFLWLVGSCNYMYGLLFILPALLPVSRALDEPDAPPMALWKAAPYFILCVLAGWTVENASAALVAAFLCSILFLAAAKRKIPLWLWAGLAGSVIGCMLLLLSPGQALRLSRSAGMGGLGIWIRRAVRITLRLAACLGAELAAMAVIFALGMKKKRPLRGLLKPAVFAVAGLAAVYSMVLSPACPNRVWSAPAALFTVALVSLWHWTWPEPVSGRRGAVIAVSALLLLSSAGAYAWAARDLAATRAQFVSREADIARVKAAGGTEVAVTPISGYTRWNCYNEDGEYLSEDPTEWPNSAYAMFYELETVYMASP